MLIIIFSADTIHLQLSNLINKHNLPSEICTSKTNLSGLNLVSSPASLLTASMTDG